MLWKITCKKTQINSNKNKNYQIIILTKEKKNKKIYTIPCAGIEWNHPTLKKNIE